MLHVGLAISSPRFFYSLILSDLTRERISTLRIESGFKEILKSVSCSLSDKCSLIKTRLAIDSIEGIACFPLCIDITF